MKRVAALAGAAVALAACADPTGAPAPAAPPESPLEPSLAAVPAAPAASTAADVAAAAAPGQPIADEYIVVFKDDVADPPGLARALAAAHGGALRHTYTAALKGFAAHLPAQAAAALANNPSVAYVEQDQVVTADLTQTGATWGLDRIDQRNLPLSGTYTYTSTAVGVRAYIIDTGIQTTHPDLVGRASAVYDAFGGNGQDCNGHGTHVAGTVGGTRYGVAKGALLRAVRVLNCSGTGSTSGIIAGIDWVRANGIHPAVANMSLGGGFSSSLNTATTNLANSGIFIAVAAGNSNANACNASPASAAGALTVAASDRTDTRASFSNFGSCVEVYAPGVSVTSDWLNGGTNTISGTSMASPHAAGVAALYKGNFGDAASATIVSWIINNATAGVIKSNPSGTPNRLLFKSTL
jgi:subtilisin family serine protease